MMKLRIIREVLLDYMLTVHSDLPIWREVCSNYGRNNGHVHSLHHFDNLVAHQIPETG
jgi:hypothetical protein